MTFKDNKVNERPVFPKRVVTRNALGHKDCILHIAGVFIHADMLQDFKR